MFVGTALVRLAWVTAACLVLVGWARENVVHAGPEPEVKAASVAPLKETFENPPYFEQFNQNAEDHSECETADHISAEDEQCKQSQHCRQSKTQHFRW